MRAAHSTGLSKKAYWTNPSVLALAAEGDPVMAITCRARQAVLEAIQSGWSGPPYDPISLAEFLGVSVQPSQNVVDARTITVGNAFRIEFNPDRPAARVNYSIAHELAHTFFPDCARMIRNRYTHAEMKGDDWQLEMLCNLGASELLMPIASFTIDASDVTIEQVLAWRNAFAVSTEAILLRYAKVTAVPCLVFAAHRDEQAPLSRYLIDYSVASRTYSAGVFSGMALPAHTVLSECTGIGFTAKGEEVWVPREGPWRIECLGIPPYPGNTYPRVVGVVHPRVTEQRDSSHLTYLKGDATSPRGSNRKILVQIVNDKALTWGRGFAAAIRNKWPDAQRDYTNWASANKEEFKLGGVFFSDLDSSTQLASLVAQHGYGPSSGLRLRYASLGSCLEKVRTRALADGATVHMPRIGTGEAGGDWNIISDIVDQTLCTWGIQVTVYDLPTAGGRRVKEQAWLWGQSA